MTRKAIVGSSIKHADLMIKWLKLDPKVWTAVAYGNVLTDTFAEAVLVHPVSGVIDAHADWVVAQLRSRVTGTIRLLTKEWADGKVNDDIGAPQLASASA